MAASPDPLASRMPSLDSLLHFGVRPFSEGKPSVADLVVETRYIFEQEFSPGGSDRSLSPEPGAAAVEETIADLVATFLEAAEMRDGVDAVMSPHLQIPDWSCSILWLSACEERGMDVSLFHRENGLVKGGDIVPSDLEDALVGKTITSGVNIVNWRKEDWVIVTLLSNDLLAVGIKIGQTMSAENIGFVALVRANEIELGDGPKE